MRFAMLWECWNSVISQSGRQSQSDSDTLFIFLKNHWVSLELKNKVSYIGMASNDKEDILEPACLCMALWMIRQIPLLMTFLIKYFLYLGTPSPSKTDEFSEKFQKVGGVIFNPKIYIAKFGPLSRAIWLWNWYKGVFSGYVFQQLYW